MSTATPTATTGPVNLGSSLAGKGAMPQATQASASSALPASNYPLPPNTQVIQPQLQGGMYNQMAQQSAGPNYYQPPFKFSATAGMTPSMPGGTTSPTVPPSNLPGAGAPTGMGGLINGTGGAGMGNIVGAGNNLNLGGSGLNSSNVLSALTDPGSTITGSSGSSGNWASILGLLGGTALGGPLGGILGSKLGSLGGSSSGGSYTLPDGTVINTGSTQAQPTSTTFPSTTVQQNQPIINPATGVPFGTPYYSTPAGAASLAQNNLGISQSTPYPSTNSGMTALGFKMMR